MHGFLNRKKIIQQPEGNFGRRIKLVLEEIYKDGFDSVIALGADTPHLDPEIIDKAISNLNDSADLVTCPSDDGGLVLLGLALPPKIDLELMPFETENLAHTFNDAGKDLDHIILEPGSYDIDEIKDLDRLMGESERVKGLAERTIAAYKAWKTDNSLPHVP